MTTCYGRCAASRGRSGNRRRWQYAAVAGAVLVVATVVTLLLVDRSADDNDDTGLTGCPTPSQPAWTPIALAGSPSVVVPDTHGTVVIAVTSASWRPSGDGIWEVQLATQMDNENTVARQHGAWFYRDLEVARRPFDPWCFNTLRDTYPDPGLIADGLIGFEVSCAPVGSMDLALTSPVSDERLDLHFTASDEPSECLDSVVAE